VVFFLDKVEETIRACDNLLLTCRTHGSPLGDWTVKETMYKTVCRILEEIDDDDCFYYHSWRNNVVIAFETLSSFLT